MKQPLPYTALVDQSTAAIGDTVKVLPTKPGGRDGYLARVRSIDLVRERVEVTVAGIHTNRCRDALRTITPNRLRQPTAAELRTIGAQR